MIKIFLCLLLTLSSVFAKIQLDERKWQESVDNDGVVILNQKVKGSDLIAFRTIYTVDAPVEKLLGVLRDAEAGTRWVKQLDKIVYISEPSDLEAIIYEVRDFPWPFNKRDLVIHYLLTINKARKSISVKFNSVDHPKFPKQEGKVRAKLKYGLFEFWPQGNQTKIELTILADPAGVIPAWVVNIFQKTQPFEYIKQLEKEAKKSKIALRPGLKSAIESYYFLFPELKK